MKFDIQRLADVLILEIQERWVFDLTNPSPLERLNEALHEDTTPLAKHVIVDFEHCPFVQSPGIGQLASIRKSVDERGGRVVLCAVSDRVRKILVVAGVWRLFDSYITRGEALNAIAAVGGKK